MGYYYTIGPILCVHYLCSPGGKFVMHKVKVIRLSIYEVALSKDQKLTYNQQTKYLTFVGDNRNLATLSADSGEDDIERLGKALLSLSKAIKDEQRT